MKVNTNCLKAILNISGILEKLTPEDRVTVLQYGVNYAFGEFCPKCGHTTYDYDENDCKCDKIM